MQDAHVRHALLLLLIVAVAAVGVLMLRESGGSKIDQERTSPSESTPAADATPTLLATGTVTANESPTGQPETSGPEVHVLGQVIDSEGNPVPGLLVRVDGHQLERVSCDAEARFDVVGLTPGTHRLQATDRQGSAVGKAVEVEIKEEQARYEVTVVVPRPWPIEGLVIDKNGEPVAALHIEFRHASGRGFTQSSTVTDARGRFSTRLWEEGAFFAEHHGVRLNGVCEAGRDDISLVYDPEARPKMLIRIIGLDGALVPRVTLTVSTGSRSSRAGGVHEVEGGTWRADPARWGKHTDILVEYPRGEDGERLALAGVVIEEVDRTRTELEIMLPSSRTIRGRVIDADGRPIPDMAIGASDHPARTSMRMLGVATSDEDGYFDMAYLPPTGVSFRVRPQGEWAPAPPTVAAPGAAAVTIRLTQGSEFQITVLNPEGEPVVAAPVSAAWIVNMRWGRRHKKTDANGKVLLRGIPPGALLELSVDTFGLATRLPGYSQRDVVVRDGGMTIRLPAPVEIRGTAVDGSGRPYAAGVIMAIATDLRVVGYADRVRPDPKTGEFVLGRLRPGTYRVWIQQDRPDLAPGAPVEVAAPATDLRLVAPRTTYVSGRLHIKNPQAWSVGWIVEPVGAVGAIGKEGHFKINYVRDGPGNLVARREGDQRVALLENVRPSDGPFDLRPVEGGRIAGSVSGIGSLPLHQVQVVVTRGQLRIGRGAVDEEGRFEVNGLPPGPWNVDLWVRGTSVARVEGIAVGKVDVLLTRPTSPR